jgi:hypothetical protein
MVGRVIRRSPIGTPVLRSKPCYGGWKGGYASAGSAEECGDATRLRVGLHDGENIRVMPVCQRKDLETSDAGNTKDCELQRANRVRKNWSMTSVGHIYPNALSSGAYNPLRGAGLSHR